MIIWDNDYVSLTKCTITLVSGFSDVQPEAAILTINNKITLWTQTLSSPTEKRFITKLLIFCRGVKTQVRGYTFEQYGLWVLVAVMVFRNTKCVFQCVCAVQVCQVAGKWFMFVLLSRAQWEGLLRCLKRSDEVIDILRMRRKLFWSSSVTFWKYRKTINHPDLCFHSGKRLKDRKQRQEEQRKVTSVITVHPPSLWIIW